MPIAKEHPSFEELTAFALGTLGEDTQASIEAHVAACDSCQKRAANAPGDSFVELLRSTLGGTGSATDAFANATGPSPTPLPEQVLAVTGPLAPPAASAAPGEPDGPEALDGLPPELARHERYRIVRVLGAGGMGTVYAAEHRVMHKLVALKVINRAVTASAAVRERFRHEVRAASSLSHPNIVTTTDAEDAGETLFLVMEYVDGTDLGRLVQERGPLPVDRACDYVRQAALGLQHAFEQGTIHRDLKPHNLMLTPEGRVKILDFGLARFASEAESAANLTGTGIVLGTADYIAPEQADNAHQADIRSDIYSLGCTLYHLLAGKPPFPTGTPLQKVMAHVGVKPRPLTEVRDDFPEELMLVLERMMAKSPTHRYQTPGEVASALESFLRAPPVVGELRPRPAEPTADIDDTGLLAKEPVRDRKRPRLLIATAILAFLVTGLLGVGVYRIATDNGELVIETDSDDVEVVVSKGGKVVKIIDAKSGKHITLNSGEYELALKGGPEGLKLSLDKMTLKRGETVLARIARSAGSADRAILAAWHAEGNAKDSAGANHGTIKGGVTFAPGVAGQAFDFNGTDGRIEFGTKAPSPHLSAGDFSISAWVNFRSLKPRNTNFGDMAIVCKMLEAGPGADGWYLLKQDDNHFWFGFGGGEFNGLGLNYPTMVRSATEVKTEVWYHVVVVKSADHFSLYVNGTKEASKTVPAFKDTDTANLLLGAADWGSHMSGLIDEVKIYNRALSAAEIKAHWSALDPANKPDRVYLYDLEEMECSVLDMNSSKAAKIAIAVNGVKFRKGLWTHPQNKGSGWVKFRLSGLGATTFVTKVAINDSALPTLPALLTFQALGDGKVLWTSVPTKERGQIQECRISVKDVGVLELRVDCSGWNGWAHAVWLDPYLLPSGPRKTAIVGEVQRFEGHTGDAHGVAYSPNGRYAVSCSGWPTGDGTIRVWEVATGKQIHKFDSLAHPRPPAGTQSDRPQQNVLCVAFSPDGRHIVYGGDGNTAVLVEVATGKDVWRFTDFKDAVLSLAFSPDGRQIIAAGQDGFARVFDAATGKELCKFDGHLALNQADGSHKRVMQAMFLPGGKRAISCGDNNSIYLWDAVSGEKLQTFEGHKGVPNCLAISPDGRQLLSGSWEDKDNYRLMLWNVAAGKLVREFSGHAGGVAQVAFSHDGRRAISASQDKTVRLWEVATGKELHCFTGHTDGLWGVAFSPDDRYAISASQDTTLRLWRLPEPPPAQKAP